MSGNQPHAGFMVRDNLFYKDRLVIPSSSKLITDIIGVFHGFPSGGPSREAKTYQRIIAELY